MELQIGLFDKIVLQRNKSNRSDAIFSGTCDADGVVTARVTRGGKAVPGFAKKRVGKANRGKFEGRLKGLPVGGPYDVTLSIDKTDEKITVKSVLVGDVWILGGQSNMQGYGPLTEADTPDRNVRAFYMNDEWDTAEDPIHNLADAIDPVHEGRADGKRTPRRKITQPNGTGPGVTFGKEMFKATDVPQGLIACAHGGTSMEQWDPAKKKLGGKSLYGAMVRRFRKNGSRVAGVLWYQGCSEAMSKTASVYTKRMKKLIASMRRDFGDARLPVAAVQIGRFIAASDQMEWNDIQDQQRRLPEVIDRMTVVPVIDLELSDGIHLSGVAQQTLGRRLAQAMRVLCGDRSAGKPPIALKSIAVENDRKAQKTTIIVTFDNVMGELCATGRPAGFAMTNPQLCPLPYAVKLKGNRAFLHVPFDMNILAAHMLCYGYGGDPYCNITDAAGRSLPVFGPVPMGHPKALYTPFFSELRVSRPQSLAGSVASLKCPADPSALDFHREVSAVGGMFNVSEAFRKLPDESVVYFACKYNCDEAMTLQLAMGYDGPVKVWCDGKEIFCDPKGTNPAEVDKICFDLPGSAGDHELMIALASNGGKAWGIRARMIRKNIRKKSGQAVAYGIPRILG